MQELVLINGGGQTAVTATCSSSESSHVGIADNEASSAAQFDDDPDIVIVDPSWPSYMTIM
jgi:hypothetical protein